MITDRIGRHEVLLRINDDHYNFREQVDVTKTSVRHEGGKLADKRLILIETITKRLQLIESITILEKKEEKKKTVGKEILHFRQSQACE